MTAKSVIDVEINDEDFKKFVALFNKHREMVKQLPGDWGKVTGTIEHATDALDAAGEATGEMAGSSDKLDKRWERVHRTTVNVTNNFEAMAAAMMAQLQHLRNVEKEEARQEAKKDRLEREREQREKARERRSKKLVDDAKNIATSTKDALVSMVKWAGIGTLAGGLLGGGGLLGLDRLADVTGNARRAALGLGVSTGEQQAYRVNFSRFLDTDTNLQNIAAAKSDYSKRWAFGAMGVNPNGRDPAQLAVEMALKAKKMFDRSDQSEQFAQAHGLLQFYTMEDLRRLHNMSEQELQKQTSQYGQDKKTFALSDNTLRQWQDFSTQMHRAGLQIESVFVRGLEGITPSLLKLSQSLADIVQATMDSPEFKKWVAGLGDEIKQFAEYLGSDDFQKKLRQFIYGVDLVGQEILAVAEKLKWLLPHPAPAGTDNIVTGSGKAWGTGGNVGSSSSPDATNPGNLRVPGSSSQFQKFGSRRLGVYAMAQQLRRYEQEKKWGHADTVEKIVKLYAPPNENDTEGYIRDVSKWTGFKRGQHLDLNDNQVLAALEAAMLRKENKHNTSDLNAATVGTIITQLDARGDKADVGSKAPQAAASATAAPSAGSSRRVDVHIHNNTGGSAVVSTSQLAQ